MPIIGPRTVEQLDDHLAALNIDLGEHYDSLGEVSRVGLGQPHEQDMEQLPAVLGGNGFRVR